MARHSREPHRGKLEQEEAEEARLRKRRAARAKALVKKMKRGRPLGANEAAELAILRAQGYNGQ